MVAGLNTDLATSRWDVEAETVTMQNASKELGEKTADEHEDSDWI